MLTNVPQAVRTGVRAMVLRHPNAMDCEVFRKASPRTFGAEAGDLGGMPSLGGLAVLNNDDEAEVDFMPLGQGRILFTGVMQPAKLADSRDFPESAPVGEAMVEPVEPGAFALKDGDLVVATPGSGVGIPYEVTKVLTMIHIPPYVQRVELSQQGEAMFDADIAAMLADRP